MGTFLRKWMILIFINVKSKLSAWVWIVRLYPLLLLVHMYRDRRLTTLVAELGVNLYVNLNTSFRVQDCSKKIWKHHRKIYHHKIHYNLKAIMGMYVCASHLWLARHTLDVPNNIVFVRYLCKPFHYLSVLEISF